MSLEKSSTIRKPALPPRHTALRFAQKSRKQPAAPGAHPHSAQLTSWSDFKRALKMDA